MAKFLSDELEAEIRALIAASRNNLEGAGSGGGTVHDFPPTPYEPDDYVCLTPAAGIAARSGTTIYSALCNVYRDKASGTAGQRTLEAITSGGSPWQLLVYNLSNALVGGNKYVVTSRTKTGTRYVVVESCTDEA